MKFFSTKKKASAYAKKVGGEIFLWSLDWNSPSFGKTQESCQWTVVSEVLHINTPVLRGNWYQGDAEVISVEGERVHLHVHGSGQIYSTGAGSGGWSFCSESDC